MTDPFIMPDGAFRMHFDLVKRLLLSQLAVTGRPGSLIVSHSGRAEVASFEECGPDADIGAVGNGPHDHRAFGAGDLPISRSPSRRKR